MVFLDGYMDKEYTSVHCSHPSVEGGALAESFHSPIFSNFVLLIIRTVICFSKLYLCWQYCLPTLGPRACNDQKTDYC